MKNISELSILQIASLIKEKDISPVEITKNLLDKIEKVNKTNNAFITICKETALREAKVAENEIMNGNYKGPLHGVPLSIKDNISVKDTRCTSGSLINQDYISENDAPVIKHLRSNGAIIIGKTNLDEFANDVTGKNKTYGIIKNPINDNHSAGGSSGGSAVSVASNLSYGSIGTDTSGSVRIPAACCGIVGLKPSYNLIPTLGVKPLSWSLDHVGILAKDCKDLYELFHSTVPGFKQASPNFERSTNLNHLTVGIPESYFFESLETSVEAKIREIVNIFKIHGAKIKHIKTPDLQKGLEAQETIIMAESAYNHKFNLVQNKEYYNENNYSFFESGLKISQNQYSEALTFKQEINRDMQQIFSKIDIFLTPTLPITAPKLTTEETVWKNNKEDILSTLSRYTGPFNVSGLPALSVPVGFSSEGLPISLQIVGEMYSENKLISIGDWVMEKVG